jgi:hypothetical protein
MSELPQRHVPVLQDPFDPVGVELTLVEEFATAIYGEELAGLIGVVF